MNISKNAGKRKADQFTGPTLSPTVKKPRLKPPGLTKFCDQPGQLLSHKVIGRHWHGLDKVESLVVFGDSTTRLGDCTTWLGHLLQSLTQTEYNNQHAQAYNYATPGHTVDDDLSDQLDSFFEQWPKKKDPRQKPSLNPSKTLYVLWLGINDCGRTETCDLDEIVEKLFQDGLDELYTKAGARNFLIIDVPPKDRSPAALKLSVDLSERYLTWNKLLQSRTESFASDSSQASVFLFSAYQIVSAVLNDPEVFGFQEDDVAEEGGAIWMDDLHMTAEVHAIVAKCIEMVLRAVCAYTS